jgi:Mrp family chromosome partitioning ATPase
VGRFSASLIEAFDETSTIDAAIQPVPGFSAVSLAQLTVANETLRNVDYGDLRRLFDLARQKFSIIILDCPPATEAPDLLALARYSDGTVFVVRADATSRRVIAETKQAIERFGGQILGVVFNQRRSYIPRWMQWWFS